MTKTVLVYDTDNFVFEFRRTLDKIDPDLYGQLRFEGQVQRNNLTSLLHEIDQKIDRYENIYPFIKEICRGQSIDPHLYSGIESTLNWALAKGRGRGRTLPPDIKEAWMIYIVLLSCSMIDKSEIESDQKKKFRRDNLLGQGK